MSTNPDSKITPELMTALRAANPGAKGFRKLTTTQSDGAEIEAVVRYPPSPAAYALFREKLLEQSAAEKASANRILINDMIVYPTEQELRDTIRDYPGMVEVWAGECAEIAGAVRGTRQEKL